MVLFQVGVQFYDSVVSIEPLKLKLKLAECKERWETGPLKIRPAKRKESVEIYS